ncbi:hypothetical protein [Streptomyces carminius]|uniref:hypothetical protein n=1 Tax=Streptomyces carminius TaxID=2665496 RepID=UPI0038CD8DE5
MLFADQVGIRSDRVTGRTWGAKGHFMVFTESLDAKVVCRFPDRLVGHFHHKIRLVVDRHSAHRSNQTEAGKIHHPCGVPVSDKRPDITLAPP